MDRERPKFLASFAACCAVALYALAFVWPQHGASQAAPAADEPLPTRVVIDVDSPERALYKISIPDILGGSIGAQGAEVIRNDLTLSSLFQVLDQRGFIADLNKEGLGYDKTAWSSVGTQGLVKGQITSSGSNINIEMRLYELARGDQPVLSKKYNGGAAQLRSFMHDFANQILLVLTGKAGAFGTHLTYARKIGVGRKDVFVSDFDGHNEWRASNGTGNAMLPAFGAYAGIWYSVLTDMGAFLTNTKNRGRPVIQSDGLSMGPSICNGRVYFSSTRDGNSEIYSATLEGADVRRLTNNPAIDVSPACGPGGKIAFVSSRHGGPQIFVMDGNGGGASRVSYKGAHNQTPSWCMDPSSPMIAYSARDGGGFDIITLNLKTGEYKRLTQGQGTNQDPAFSPDCRMVAFSSSRGGVFISNPDGLNQIKFLSGNISTVRWGK